MQEPLLVEGGSVVLTNIGTLTTTERAVREYRNPRTGDSVGKRAVLSLRFQPSRNLREQLKAIV